MACRGLFIIHSCTASTGSRGLISLVCVLIERWGLSGFPVGVRDPGRVTRDPPVTIFADPDHEMAVMPLMRGILVLLQV